MEHRGTRHRGAARTRAKNFKPRDDRVVSALDDGTYDALVVDADARDGGDARIELVVTSGARKGEVVSVRASGLTEDPLLLLGLPATIRVVNGEIDVQLDD